MFQNNDVLIELKKKLNSRLPRVEGIVKSNEKGFGFLEIDHKKSYFIPPGKMNKIMHGDKIIAKLDYVNNREVAIPEKLIEPILTRFIGQVKKKEKKIFIIPDYPFFKKFIPCSIEDGINHKLKDYDWVVAHLIHHKLNNYCDFYAKITEFIISNNDYLVPWFVTLSKYNLQKYEPKIKIKQNLIDENCYRKDLTSLDFITIDNFNTQDIDDALFAKKVSEDIICLTVAIADPTSYFNSGSEIDLIAMDRSFTNYLPGFNIPMLPRYLSEDLCSLKPKVRRPVIACEIYIQSNGNIIKDKTKFFLAWIKSKLKLSYEIVANYITNKSNTYINSNIINQIELLNIVCNRRLKWRKKYALVFQNNPEYYFQIGEKYEVKNIIIEHRNIAHQIVEEAMISANICAAHILSNKLKFGIYNTHIGFDSLNAENVIKILDKYSIKYEKGDFSKSLITTLKGFKLLRNVLDKISNKYINNKIKKLQSFVEISLTPKPHFALGLESYATWTSPIRKYTDIINHRLIKSIINKEKINKPKKNILLKIIDSKRKNRLSERDVTDWLYTIFLQKIRFDKEIFIAEIVDIYRGGVRVRLLKFGAYAFIPAPFIHKIRNELICNKEDGTVKINNILIYSIGDEIKVKIIEIKTNTRSVIVKPI
ncbi:exoribonuclease II [Buchnera aphidicola (Neophyllaphis varicolor)]|uniref:exoribonuclease II n=1 Tax=Buchnera aphidicola TaxID=9 RepID=UPI0031B884FB